MYLKIAFHIIIAGCCFLAGIASTQIADAIAIQIIEYGDNQVKTLPVQAIPFPRFQVVTNYRSETFATYDFKSIEGNRLERDSCTGWLYEVGDVHVYHDYTSEEHARYLFDANAANSLEYGWLAGSNIELNESGSKIGQAAVIGSQVDCSATILLRRGSEFWRITASSLELAKEFENSESFKFLKTGGFLVQD